MKKSESTLKKRLEISFDLLIFIPAVLLFVIGLVSLYSCLSGTANEALFVRQLIFGLIGITICVVIYFVSNKWLLASAIPIYAVSMIMLILVLTGLGTEINGTQGWIRLAGFSFQPAEFAKIATVLFVAWRLASKFSDVKFLSDFLIITGAFALPSVAILFQPDFGSFSVILVLYFGMLYWSGFSGFILYSLACLPVLIFTSLIDITAFYILAAVMFVFAFLFKRKLIMTIIVGAIFYFVGLVTPNVVSKLADYQQARIQTFLNPELDPLGSGYNVLQSLIAIGSGGIWGKGFMQGSQTQLRFIPMQWTDFIFSVPMEEFGFVGALVIILLFVWILWRGTRIAFNATSKFNSLLAIGCVFIMFYHCIINIGMTIGLVPVTGIPLPFLSYGGTALVMNFVLIGILLHINRINIESQAAYK